MDKFSDKIHLSSNLRDLLIKAKSEENLKEEEKNYLLKEGLIYESGGSIKLTDKGVEKLKKISDKIDVLEFYNSHPYIRPAVAVDGIIFYEDKLILIKRGNEPYKGMYALPGGFVNYNEKVEDAFLREMKEEIGVEIYNWRLFTVLSDPKRDPRGHTISIVFEGYAIKNPVAGDDAAEILLINIKKAMKLKMAFDHQEVLKKFIQCRSLPR